MEQTDHMAMVAPGLPGVPNKITLLSLGNSEAQDGQGAREDMSVTHQQSGQMETTRPVSSSAEFRPETEALPDRNELTALVPYDALATATAIDGTHEQTIYQPFLERAAGFIKRHKVILAAGAVAVASLIFNPIGETLQWLSHDAPYVGAGMLISETAWIAGAGAALASIGRLTLNPFKIRSKFKELEQMPGTSTVFKAGLALNTAGALAEFVIPTVAVTTHLPVEAWGVLSFSSLDLWATIVIRHAIWRAMHPQDDTSQA